MKNKNIIRIRRKLDVLDDKMLRIIKSRSLLVDKVLKNKIYKKDIIDKQRINLILKRIRLRSKKMKIDESITLRIWKSMIRGFILYEYKNFKKK
ncbi:MAG: chorismate mutase [Candidatus Pelagibacter sp.]|nr:chorismate mutase [Candidatus Pelagibacter sp.]